MFPPPSCHLFKASTPFTCTLDYVTVSWSLTVSIKKLTQSNVNKWELTGCIPIPGPSQQLEEQAWKCPRPKRVKGQKQRAHSPCSQKNQSNYSLHPSVKVLEEYLIGQPWVPWLDWPAWSYTRVGRKVRSLPVSLVGISHRNYPLTNTYAMEERQFFSKETGIQWKKKVMLDSSLILTSWWCDPLFSYLCS